MFIEIKEGKGGRKAEREKRREVRKEGKMSQSLSHDVL